jgi:hypothetical protein
VSLAPADTVWGVPATVLLARSAGPQVVGERLVLGPPDGLKEGMRVAAEETKRD